MNVKSVMKRALKGNVNELTIKKRASEKQDSTKMAEGITTSEIIAHKPTEKNLNN